MYILNNPSYQSSRYTLNILCLHYPTHKAGVSCYNIVVQGCPVTSLWGCSLVASGLRFDDKDSKVIALYSPSRSILSIINHVNYKTLGITLAILQDAL